MVLFLDLDEDDDSFVHHARPRGLSGLLSQSLAMTATVSEGETRQQYEQQQQQQQLQRDRPNPNLNVFSAALGCYP